MKPLSITGKIILALVFAVLGLLCAHQTNAAPSNTYAPTALEFFWCTMQLLSMAGTIASIAWLIACEICGCGSE